MELAPDVDDLLGELPQSFREALTSERAVAASYKILALSMSSS